MHLALYARAYGTLFGRDTEETRTFPVRVPPHSRYDSGNKFKSPNASQTPWPGNYGLKHRDLVNSQTLNVVDPIRVYSHRAFLPLVVGQLGLFSLIPSSPQTGIHLTPHKAHLYRSSCVLWRAGRSPKRDAMHTPAGLEGPTIPYNLSQFLIVFM